MTPTQTVLAYGLVAANGAAGLYAIAAIARLLEHTPAFRYRWRLRWWRRLLFWLAALILFAVGAGFGCFGLPGLLNGLQLP